MEQKQPLQQMVLGDLDSYVQKNETLSPTYTIQKNKIPGNKPNQGGKKPILRKLHNTEERHPGRHKQMETYTMSMDWKNYHHQNGHTTQSDL